MKQNKKECIKYERQEQVEFIPEGFQNRIKDKKIVLIGCGGVGSPLAELLIRGGFCNIALVDYDKIDETNLQRQIFYLQDIDLDKPIALAVHLQKINDKINVEAFNMRLDSSNIDMICSGSDLIVDATDNFETRYLINDYCEKNNKDWVYSAAVRTEFSVCTFKGGEKLFSKVFSTKVKNVRASDVGILASTTFAAASLVYNQVLKYFLGSYESKLIKINLWTNQIHEVKIK